MAELAKFKFRVTIEGEVPAKDEDSVRRYAMSELSFSARFGLTIKAIDVEAEPLAATPPLYGPDGVRTQSTRRN